MRIGLLILLALFASQEADIRKKDLYGSYKNSETLPGLIIQENDSTEVHVSPLNVSSSILELKRFGRFEEKSTFDGEGPFVLRGRWTFDGDSVRLLVLGEIRDVFTPHQGGLLHRNGNFYYQKIKD